MADGCRFITGDPREVLSRGEAVYCGRPVARVGGCWCAAHHALCHETEERRAGRAALAVRESVMVVAGRGGNVTSARNVTASGAPVTLHA